MNELKVNKLLKIKNYEEGKNGNMMVVLTDKVVPLSIDGPDGDVRDVEVLICTANINGTEFADAIESVVDKYTPCNKVIVVSEKFRKLNNKLQLVLLEIENQKYWASMDRPYYSDAPLVQAEINAIEKFGIIAEWFAVNTARRFREKSQRCAAKGLHKQYKKDMDLERNMSKTARNIFRYEEKKEAKEPSPAV